MEYDSSGNKTKLFTFKNLRTLIYVSIVFSGVYVSFIVSNRDNPVRLSYTSVQELYSVFPQGWAFFTRNPKEEVLQLYQLDQGKLLLVNNSTSLSFKDFFGFKRRTRKVSAELAEIIKKVPVKSWKEYRGREVSEVLKSLMLSDTVPNVFEEKLLTGEYIVYRSKRVPWAWSKSSVKLPYRAVKIYVK